MPRTPFQYAVKKYGVKAFVRTTLKIFDSRQDALDLERWLVDEEFVKRTDTYNIILGGGNKDLIPTNSRIVYVYDRYGKFIREFPTATSAAQFIYNNKQNASLISKAAKSGTFCKEYQVSYIKVPYMKDYISYKRKVFNKMCNIINSKYKDNKILHIVNPVKIAQYTIDGKLIKIWESMAACKKAGFTNVQGVVEGRRNKCKGYVFKYYKN